MAKLEQGKLCPLIGEDCRKLECSWYTKIAGVNPQTGDSVEEWGCAVAWIPFLQMDNTKIVNQQGAAVESFRNEVLNIMGPVATIKPIDEPKLIDVNETDNNS